MKKIITLIGLVALTWACDHRADLADAYGNFEADEIILSAEQSGKITSLKLEEGMMVEAQEKLGSIDTSMLALQLGELEANKAAVKSQITSITAQIATLKQQLENSNLTLNRVEKLHTDGAATDQQLEDVEGAIKMIESQIAAAKTQYTSVQKQLAVFDAKAKLIQEQLKKCNIVSPVKATILESYLKQGEMAMMGKAICKMANLETLDLRCYISGDMLSSLKLGQQVTVKIDLSNKVQKELSGTISWIASEAEFTPKTIQTKQERVKQVYALKVKVVNDGSLKIGMPAELYLK